MALSSSTAITQRLFSRIMAHCLAALCACGDPTSERPLPAAPGTCSERPPATRRDELVEELHGTPVADPYRWLEDHSDPAVQGWMRVQDDHARAQLAALPAGPALRARDASQSFC